LVPVKQLISASVTEKNRHQVSTFTPEYLDADQIEGWREAVKPRNCFSPKASVETKIQLGLF
jgi:hypothetical protein